MRQQGPQQKGEEQRHGDGDDNLKGSRRHKIKYRQRDNEKG